MSKSSESNAQLGDYSQQYCIIYIKDARRLDHNCSHHEKEMIIMWQDGSVSKVVHYINVSHQHEYTLKMHRVIYQLHLKQTNKQANRCFESHSSWIPAPNSYLSPVWSETNHKTPMRADTCMWTTDSLYCIPETNTILQVTCTPIKIKQTRHKPTWFGPFLSWWLGW